MNKTRKLSLKVGVVSVVILIFNFLMPFSPHVVYAQTCTVPVQVTGVAIVFPNCPNGACSYSQGSCSWTAVTGATGYNAIITAVTANTQVLNQQAYTLTTLAFPVATSDTYRCDVTAINSCGTGVVGTSSLLCSTEFVVTPTLTPTSVPVPTAANIPTKIPLPMAPTGSNDLILPGFAGLVMVAIGFSMLLLL